MRGAPGTPGSAPGASPQARRCEKSAGQVSRSSLGCPAGERARAPCTRPARAPSQRRGGRQQVGSWASSGCERRPGGLIPPPAPSPGHRPRAHPAQAHLARIPLSRASKVRGSRPSLRPRARSAAGELRARPGPEAPPRRCAASGPAAGAGEGAAPNARLLGHAPTGLATPLAGATPRPRPS